MFLIETSVLSTILIKLLPNKLPLIKPLLKLLPLSPLLKPSFNTNKLIKERPNLLLTLPSAKKPPLKLPLLKFNNNMT